MTFLPFSLAIFLNYLLFVVKYEPFTIYIHYLIQITNTETEEDGISLLLIAKTMYKLNNKQL